MTVKYEIKRNITEFDVRKALMFNNFDAFFYQSTGQFGLDITIDGQDISMVACDSEAEAIAFGNGNNRVVKVDVELDNPATVPNSLAVLRRPTMPLYVPINTGC